MTAIEIEAMKANLITSIVTGIHTSEALEQINRLVGKLVSYPCETTPNEMQARFEKTVSDHQNGKTIPLKAIHRK